MMAPHFHTRPFQKLPVSNRFNLREDKAAVQWQWSRLCFFLIVGAVLMGLASADVLAAQQPQPQPNPEMCIRDRTKLTHTSSWSTISLNYAWSKNMGNPTTSGGFKDYGASEYWTVLNISRKNVFNASYVFSTPQTHLANHFLNGVVNGYQLSGITQLQSGAQLSATAGNYYYNLQNGPNGVYSVGSPDVTVAPVMTCNASLGLKAHQFANPSCFAYPTQGSGIGNTRMRCV